MKIRETWLPALCLVGTAFLLGPTIGTTSGYSIFSGPLELDQRHWRFGTEWQDDAANDNVNAQANFPGARGGLLALWKGAAEWGSRAHGNGAGDPSQPVIGSGGANFDFYFAGYATGPGGGSDQVIASLPNCAGGVLAFVDTPFAGGWRMTFCEQWTWHDGPGGLPSTFFDFDIQTTATHEFGHALGLGHSTVADATMFPIYATNAVRSIEQDDIDGVQAIYGVADPTKPEITSLGLVGTTLTIDGLNFAAVDNEVWFTNLGPTAPSGDPTRRVTGLASTNGGTRIVVNVPPNATSGDVHVRRPGTAHGDLSNGYPFLFASDAFLVQGVYPSQVPALIPGAEPTIRVAGSNLDQGLSVAVNGVPAGSTSSPDPQTLLFEMPQTAQLGQQLLSISSSSRTLNIPIEVVPNAQPTLQIGNVLGESPVDPALGVDMILAGLPGELHVVAWSPSPVQSIAPGVVTLSLGNAFSQLFLAGPNLIYTIPSSGWIAFNQGASTTVSGMTFYAQSVRLTGGTPYAVSSLQSFTFL